VRAAKPKLSLRPAAAEDAKLLWRWANDPVVRAASFNSARIPWPTHEAWFAKRLTRPRRARIYLAHAGGSQRSGSPVGQVRFEKSGPARAVISVVVAPDQRGRGIGATLIREGCQQARKDLSVRRVLAYIRDDNAASIAAFERAGFTRLRRSKVRGNPALLLVWQARS
jgi:UDP-2,4-diacetamido-2,4,6-trideoxy-beta-L-altropyranose hydrolase